jgi:hypothetical protein
MDSRLGAGPSLILRNVFFLEHSGIKRRSLRLLCHDKKDVPQIQVKIPMKEPGFVEIRIEIAVIVFQAEYDVRHGVDTAIHALGTDVLNFEPVSAEQSTQCFAGKVVEMSWGMYLTPLASSGAGHPAIEITGRQCQQASPREQIRDLFDVEIRLAQMFDRIPHANNISPSDNSIS